LIAAHWPALLGAALWIAMLIAVVARFLDSKRLDEYPATIPAQPPLVSVIIPARNEAHNIERCLTSVLSTTYPMMEVIVVDDHSTDGTGEIARRIATADVVNGFGFSRVRIVEAPPLPSDWFGKQWACHNGALAARGDLLCFIDADTWHGPELLARSVNAMQARGAALFTVAGHQEMGSFWEKVIQPFVFVILLARYGGLEKMSRSTNPFKKIANGQFMLIDRAAYDEAGGHVAVKTHVAEDLRMAQRFTELGMSAQMVLARDEMATRMYTSLGEIRRGWGKNVYAGGRDTLPLNAVTRRLLPFAFPFAPLAPLLPLIVACLAWLGVLGDGALIFGATGAVANALFWMGTYGYARLNPLWGLLYPVAACVLSFIFAEAAWRGSKVAWKGRDYISERAQ
jgi:chlorobactene glucosyltransferase